MSLIDEFMQQCVMLEPVSVPDGEGGQIITWKDGDTFAAAVVNNSSAEAYRADQAGLTRTYTVTTDRDVVLKYHNVFRRVSDGMVFRVTSAGDDVKTPEVSDIRPFSQVTAEEWRTT